jgi:flagellin FlaB
MNVKLVNFLKGKDNASIGVGAMIVFIAMVLVAGIAASVIIQTATNLEMQALRTGQATITEVASGLNVEAVEGNANISNNVIDKMAVEIKCRAGSPDIDLSETVIEISDSATKHLLRYSNSGATDDSDVDGAIFNVSNFGSGTTFDIIVLQDADGSVASSSVINFGDHVILAIDTAAIFTTNNGLLPRTDISGVVISEEGVPGIIGFTTPSSYTSAKQIMELQ